MNIYELEDLLKGRITKDELKGKTFCFTGKCLRSREELEARVFGIGGIVKKSVVRKLDYLVRPDGLMYRPSKKTICAEIEGAKIITESEFVKMVE